MLHNLPTWSGNWYTESLLVPVAFGQWTEILIPDPTRWFLLFSVANKGPVLVWTQNPDGVSDGIEVLTSSPFSLKYQDAGTLVQGSWYCWDISGIGSIAVLAAYWRPTQLDSTIPPRGPIDVS